MIPSTGGWCARAIRIGLAFLAVSACGAAPEAPLDREVAVAELFENIRDNPEQLREFLSEMPLGGDLHHHVGGSAPPEMIIGFAAEDGLCLPIDPAAAWRLQIPPCDPGLRPVADALNDPELHAEIERRWSMEDYASNDPAIVRAEANDHFFSTFDKIRQASLDLGRLLAGVRSLAAEFGVSYLETSSGWVPDRAARAALPELPMNDDLLEMRRALLANPQFISVRDSIVAELPRQLVRSEELLGCAGAEPDPGCDVEVRFQRSVPRNQSPAHVFIRILMAYEVAQRSDLVVGVNLMAPETGAYSIRDYALHMRMFGQLAGLYPEVRRSLHAGEMTDAQAVELGARDHLGLATAPIAEGGAAAHRIGHGVSLDAETSRGEILVRMREREIAVEINLRSNALLLGVTGEAHPLGDYLAAGVPIVLSTDDAGLMGTNLREQFELSASFPEVDYYALKRFARNSLSYSFLPAPDRVRLAERLEADLRNFESSLAGGEGED